MPSLFQQYRAYYKKHKPKKCKYCGEYEYLLFRRPYLPMSFLICFECKMEMEEGVYIESHISDRYCSGGTMTIGGQASLNIKGVAKIKL